MQTDQNEPAAPPLLTRADRLAQRKEVPVVTLDGEDATVTVHAVPYLRQLELAQLFITTSDDAVLLAETLRGDPAVLLCGLEVASVAHVRNVAAAFILGERTIKKLMGAAPRLTAPPIPTAGSSPDSSLRSSASPPVSPPPAAGASASSNSSAESSAPAKPAANGTGSPSSAAPTTAAQPTSPPSPASLSAPPIPPGPKSPNSATPNPPAAPSSN